MMFDDEILGADDELDEAGIPLDDDEDEEEDLLEEEEEDEDAI